MTDFKAKMHQIRFRLGLRPRPRWGSLQRSPRPPSWIWGALLLRRGKGRGGEERGGEVRGRKGRRGEGKGGDGRERRGGEGRRGKGRGGKEKGHEAPQYLEEVYAYAGQCIQGTGSSTIIWLWEHSASTSLHWICSFMHE